MTGTIINVAAIVAGGFGGLAFGKVLTKNRQDMLMQVLGLCTMFLGIGGAWLAGGEAEGRPLGSGGRARAAADEILRL